LLALSLVGTLTKRWAGAFNQARPRCVRAAVSTHNKEDSMNHPTVADSPAPGAVPPSPSALPRAVWIGAGAVALTIAGIASALAWRGAPSEAAPEAAAVTPAAEVAKAPEPRPVEKPVARRPAPERAVAAAPACVGCGVVVAVEAVKQAGQATGVGAVAGGVLGAAVGNQMGSGSGRTAMTVLGAIGGGVAGNAVEKNVRATTVYNVRVRLDDGTLRTLQLQQPPAVGARVQVEGGSLKTV
jgi:outer membrane lipoprotein SlyB